MPVTVQALVDPVSHSRYPEDAGLALAGDKVGDAAQAVVLTGAGIRPVISGDKNQYERTGGRKCLTDSEEEEVSDEEEDGDLVFVVLLRPGHTWG